MRVVQPMVLLSAALGFAAVSAQAQTCRGFSSLEKSHMNVGANAWFPSGSTPYGAQLNMRHDGMGWEHIISVAVGSTAYSGSGASSSFDFGGAVGFEKKTKSGLEWCPEVMAGYTTNAGGIKDLHDFDFGGGIGVGQDVGKVAGFDIVPFGKVSFVHTTFGGDGIDSENGHHFDYDAGLGFRLASGIQLSPQIDKTTVNRSDVVFGLTVSIPFGGK